MAFGDFARLDEYGNVDPLTGMPIPYTPPSPTVREALPQTMSALANMHDYYTEANPEQVFGSYDKREAKRRAFEALPQIDQKPLVDLSGGVPLEQQIEQDKELAKMFVPTSPLDVGLMAATGPLRPAAKFGALALGKLLDADPAEAGPLDKLGKLYSPGRRIAERQAAGFSSIKGGTPSEAMNWTLRYGDALPETRTAMPVDKALRIGDEIIPIVGDDTRKLAEGYLTSVGGKPLPRPVLQEGGFDFALNQPVDPRTGLRDVWGNAAGAATQIDDLAQAAAARGNRPVIMSTTMAKTGGDFSNQMFDTARQLTDAKLFSPELQAAIDRNMASNRFSQNDAVRGWPGIASENLDEFISERGGNVRAKLMKVLDQARVIKEGGPDIGMVRTANANPNLYNTPSGYMGYHIATVAPGQTGAAAHTVYPIATRGSEVRGFGGSVPGELVLRDLAAGLNKMHKITGAPQYLNRMDYYAIRPPNEAAMALGLKPLPRTQVVDQKMIDSVSEYVRKHGLKSVPPAMLAALYGRGGFGTLAAQDGYEAP